VPSEFGLPYTDLTLTAPDGVRLKAYLLTQRRHLDVHGATVIPWRLADDGDEERVRAGLLASPLLPRVVCV
jgi:hypothetical protein